MIEVPLWCVVCNDLEERVLATHGLHDGVEARLVALNHVQQLDQRPPRLPRS